jgi:LIM domain
VRQFVYHVDCLVCSICARRLDTGDQFYVVREGLVGRNGKSVAASDAGFSSTVVCRRDYDIAQTTG